MKFSPHIYLYVIYSYRCSLYHKMNKRLCFLPHLFAALDLWRENINRIKEYRSDKAPSQQILFPLCVRMSYRRRLPVCNSTIAIIVSSIPLTMNCITVHSRARLNQKRSGNKLKFIQLFNTYSVCGSCSMFGCGFSSLKLTTIYISEFAKENFRLQQDSMISSTFGAVKYIAVSVHRVTEQSFAT